MTALCAGGGQVAAGQQQGTAGLSGLAGRPSVVPVLLSEQSESSLNCLNPPACPLPASCLLPPACCPLQVPKADDELAPADEQQQPEEDPEQRSPHRGRRRSQVGVRRGSVGWGGRGLVLLPTSCCGWLARSHTCYLSVALGLQAGRSASPRPPAVVKKIKLIAKPAAKAATAKPAAAKPAAKRVSSCTRRLLQWHCRAGAVVLVLVLEPWCWCWCWCWSRGAGAGAVVLVLVLM